MFPSATTEILWMTVVIRGPSSVATFRATIEQSTKAHTAFSRGLVGQILVRRPPDLPDLLLRPCIQIASVRLTHRYATGVKVIHIEITSVRLSHRYATGVKLIYIEITSLRLSHRYTSV